MSKALHRATKTWDAFGRRFVKLRCKDGKTRPFVPNKAQLYISYKKAELIEQGRPKLFLEPKARRMGITTIETLKSFYRWRCFSGQYLATIAHREEDVKAAFDDMAVRWRKGLPDWFQPKMGRTNQKELINESNGSRLTVSSAGSHGGLVGGTFQRIHITEAALSRKSVADMDDQMAGYTEACSHGDVTVESTGRGVTGWFYETVMESIKGQSEWSTIFCPWFLMDEYSDPVPDGVAVIPGVAHDEDSLDVVDDEVDVVELAARDWGILITPGQILWRRRHRRKLLRNRKFYQEYPERIHDCFQSAAGCFFDVELLLAAKERCKLPIHSERGEGWRWLVFHDIVPGMRYIAGMDIAEGVEGGDFTYLSIHRRDTLEQVACWHGHIRPKAGARLAIGKCREYNGAEFVPERNNHGITVVDEALDMCYPGLYYHMDGKPGWRTDGQSRLALLNELADALGMDASGEDTAWSEPIKIHDRAFYDECIGFRRQASGKYEGSPDDRVLGGGITVAARARSAPMGIVSLSSFAEEDTDAA